MTSDVTLQHDDLTVTLRGDQIYHSDTERKDYARYDDVCDAHAVHGGRATARTEYEVRVATATPAQCEAILRLSDAGVVRAAGLMGGECDVIVRGDDLRERLKANRPQDVTLRLVPLDASDRYTPIQQIIRQSHIFTNQFTEQFA